MICSLLWEKRDFSISDRLSITGIQNQDFLKIFTEYIQKLLEQEEYEIIMAEIPYRLDQDAKILADLADKVMVLEIRTREAAFKLRLAKNQKSQIRRNIYISAIAFVRRIKIILRIWTSQNTFRK